MEEEEIIMGILKRLNKILLPTIYKNNAGKLVLATLSQFVIFGNIIKRSSS